MSECNEKGVVQQHTCDTCIHEQVCLFAQHYKKFCNDINEKCKTLDYNRFTATTTCRHYHDKA
jgi:hypothetical protein